MTECSQRVLVTGSETGIGKGIALEFAKCGASVVLHYAHDEEGAQSAVNLIRSWGKKAKAFKADFNKVADAKKLASDALKFLGGIDVVVNNAGITMTNEFEDTTEQQYDILYNVNVKAPYFINQTLLPELIKSRGSIINLSSIHGFSGSIGHSVYAGTKGAIISFTRELSIELAPKGVRVNAIAPGAVPVENHYKAAGTEDLSSIGKLIPSGYAGSPEDIGKVAVFLSSEAARYIIGQTIIVDGGTTSWMPFSEDFKEIGLRLGKGYVPGL